MFGDSITLHVELHFLLLLYTILIYFAQYICTHNSFLLFRMFKTFRIMSFRLHNTFSKVSVCDVTMLHIIHIY